MTEEFNRQLTLFDVEEFTQESIKIQQQPHILIKLQENALTVAENLRGNYFENTAKLIVFCVSRTKKIIFLKLKILVNLNGLILRMKW